MLSLICTHKTITVYNFCIICRTFLRPCNWRSLKAGKVFCPKNTIDYKNWYPSCFYKFRVNFTAASPGAGFCYSIDPWVFSAYEDAFMYR